MLTATVVIFVMIVIDTRARTYQSKGGYGPV